MSGKSFVSIVADTSKRLGTLRSEIPDTMQAFGAMHEAAYKQNELSPLQKELIALGIGVSQRCDGCIAFHTKALVKLGVTKGQLMETLAVAIQMGGGPSAMYAAEAVRAFEEFTAKP